MVIAKDLLAKNCQPFIKLSLLTVKKDDANANLSSVSAGRFKRIDNKGFNYIVLIDNNKQEKSFLWLRQFTGSENFTGDMTSYVGKEMKIGWQEIEVYLPQAKGYYKVKEITSISIL